MQSSDFDMKFLLKNGVRFEINWTD